VEAQMVPSSCGVSSLPNVPPLLNRWVVLLVRPPAA